MNSLYGLSGGSSKRITGMGSGMDIDSMVFNMTANSRAKIDTQYQAKQKLLWKQEAYRSSITSISTLRSTYLNSLKPDTNMLAVGFYNSSKVTTTGTSVKATAGPNAIRGDVTIDVKNLATAQKVTSGEGASLGIISEIPNVANLFNDSDRTPKEINLQIMLDGVQKKVSFKMDDGITWATDTTEILENLEKNFQNALNKTFSNDPTQPRIGVKITGEGFIEIAAKGNSKVTIAASEPGTNGAANTSNALLGLTPGTTNRLNTLKSLNEASFKTELLGTDFKFSINGVKFQFSKNDTIYDVMGKINTSAAGVKLEYSTTTDKFTMTSKTTGAGDAIDIEQTNGNLLTALFGVPPGGSFSTGKINIQEEQAMNFLDMSHAEKLAGKSFNITINGVTKTITMPPLTDANKNMYKASEYPETDLKWHDQPKMFVDEINNQISDLFGKRAISLEFNDTKDMLTLKSSDRSTTFKIEGTKGDDSIVRALGFYNGQENGSIHNNTRLADIGMKDGQFSMKGKYMKDGVAYQFDKTITLKKDDLSAPETLGELLNMEIGDGVKMRDVLNFDAATGEFSVNSDNISDFEMKDEGSNFTSKLFGASSIIGTNNSPLTTVTSGGIFPSATGDGDASALENILAGGTAIDWSAFPNLNNFSVTVDGVTKTISVEGAHTDVKSIINEMNEKIKTAFGKQDVLFTYDETSKVVSFEAQPSSVGKAINIAKNGTDPNNNILAQLGFITGGNTEKNLVPALKSTTLADLGIRTGTDSGLTVGGTFMVNGKLVNFGDNNVIDFSATDTIEDLLNKEITSADGISKIKLSEFLSFDEATGKFSMDKNKGADFKIVDGVSGNFLDSIFDESNFAGTATVVGGKIVSPVTAPVDNSMKIAGQNAMAEINGELVERDSNTFSYEGINLELLTKGETTLRTSNDTTKIFDTVKKFVEEYNKLVEETSSRLNEKINRDYRPLTPDQMAEMSEKEIERWDAAAKSGIVRGDDLLSNAMSQLRNILYQKPANSDISLFDLGITTGNYLDGGKLVIDEVKFQKRLDENAEGVGALFANYDGDGLMQKMDKVFDDAIRSTGARKGYLVEESGIKDDSTDTLNTMSKSISKLDAKIKELQTKYKRETDALYVRFSSLETYMNNMNQQASWLAQQFQ